MFNFYGIALLVCFCGFIVNVIVLVVQYIQIRKLLRKRNELLDDLGISKEELKQKPHVEPFVERKPEASGDSEEKSKTKQKQKKKVRFEGLSSLSTDQEKGRYESGKEESSAESTEDDDEENNLVGTAFTSDINAFTTFLEEYQTALDSPIQVSSLRPYQPGSLLTKFPFPPEKSSTTTAVLKQLIVDILRHSTHWQHPRYFGPNGPGRSVPDVAAHLFLPFLSPTIIELEKKTMSFMKKALEIPSEYAKEALVESATEAVYHVLLMGRSRMLDKLFEREEAPGKMVAYCSTSANASVSKACRLAMMRLHRIEGMDAAKLEAAIKKDNADGLQPTLVVSTFTSSAYSNPEEKPEFFKMAAQYDLYIHVDASAVGGFWLHPAARRARPSLLEVDSVFLEMFYMSEGMKMVWIKKDTKWREPLTQHSHKAVQIFSVFALLGLEEMKRRLEFYSALANELRMEMAKFPMISTSAWDNFNTFCFQYKPSTSDPRQISYYTKRLYAYLQQSHRFYFGYTQTGQKHKQAVIVATVMGGAMSKPEMQEMLKELRKMLEEFELKKDDPKLFSLATSPPPSNSPFPFVPMSNLHYDVTTF